ncbi:Major royal jelly protein [Nesidiocoris tenuis]|uniref:Major royal jelly protein n=1 Tax=Nesidiocoris tenuis TaxID=355587 RepID=A0ABN7B807_9HEMI|nr:Major royal jelly protein [Nesidiocoris tenuis]
MRGLLGWCLLVAVGIVLAVDDVDKDLSPVEWVGGLTVDSAGEKHYNGVATRAQIFGREAFVTIPKLKPDVKYTCCKLNMTKEIGKETEHILTPFPPGKLPDPETCEGLQSAVDLVIDHFNTIWVLDVGAIYPPKVPHPHHIEDPSRPAQPVICPPKIVAYDAESGKKLHEINLLKFVGPMSRLQFIISDYSSKGSPYVYVTDAGTKKLIVWDVDANEGTAVPLPENCGTEFTPRDVLYAVLVRKSKGNNKIYFTYRSGESMWSIETKYLQEERSMDKAEIVAEKPAKMIILGTDDWNCIYFRYENNPDIYKWDSDARFMKEEFTLVHKSKMIPTHVMPDYDNGCMRVLECPLVEYLQNKIETSKSYNSLTTMCLSEKDIHPPEEPIKK